MDLWGSRSSGISHPSSSMPASGSQLSVPQASFMSEGGPAADQVPSANMFGQTGMPPAGPLQAPGGAFLQEGHRLGVSGEASSTSEGKVVTESGRKSSVVPVDLKALLADPEAYTESLLSKPMEVSPVIAKLNAELRHAEDLWEQGQHEASWHLFKQVLRRGYNAEEDKRHFDVYAKNVSSVVELKHEAMRTGARINFGLTNAADSLSGGCC